MENEYFPSLVKEVWLRLQFRLLTFTTCGDGVVKAKSIRCISTTSPNPPAGGWVLLLIQEKNFSVH
jgi:hypothetical protein